MTVLEFLTLRISPTLSEIDPKVLSALVTSRTTLASLVHDTQSRFYRDTKDPAIIYLFGEWDSVSQHAAFLESSVRDKVLAPQKNVLSFVEAVHLRFPENGGIGKLFGGRERLVLRRGLLRDEGVVFVEEHGKEGEVVELSRGDKGMGEEEEKEVYVFDFRVRRMGTSDKKFRGLKVTEMMDLETEVGKWRSV